MDAFYLIAQTQNFTAAAEKMRVTQPALSQRIAKLEDELGCTLFIRDRAGLQLTAAGSRLLILCQQQEALERECLGDLHRTTDSPLLTGTLRIGAYSSISRSVVLPMLEPLLQKNPELRFELITRELRELPQLLLSGRCDFVFLDIAYERDGVLSSQVGEEISVLVERRTGEVGEYFLDHDESDVTSLRYLKLTNSKPSKNMRRRFLGDVYAVIDGAAAGLGRAIVPRHLIATDARLRVVDRNLQLKNPVVLHYFQQPYYTRLQKTVLEIFEKDSKIFLKRSF